MFLFTKEIPKAKLQAKKYRQTKRKYINETWEIWSGLYK